MASPLFFVGFKFILNRMEVAMRIMVKLLVLAACGSLIVAVQAEQGQAAIQINSVAHGTSTPLNAHAPMLPGWKPGTQPNVIHYPRRPGNGGGGGGTGGGGSWSDPALQTSQFSQSFSTGTIFQGQQFTGAIPPDTNLSVGGPAGSTQIVQVVNTSIAIYDTSGSLLASGDIGLSLFSALPASANCNANMDGGDPIVLWDQLDSRWIISQLAYDSTFSQNDFCLAISLTDDATKGYEVYDFSFGGSVPDYPKLGIWSDGIYFSANMFKISVNQRTGLVRSSFLGAQACSFPRSSVSSPGSGISLTCSGAGNTAIYNILPASLDGTTLPPAGPGYFLQFVTNLSTTSGNQLALYQLQNGSLVSLGNLSVDTFHEACGGGTCVPQLGTTQTLDSLGDRLMYRLSYRNYGSTQAMVVNHAVQVSSSSNQTGIRWYQLCGTAGSPFSVCKQGTFSPDTSTYRWMGSIAQDKLGNLGLGYSESSSSIFPRIAVTGLQNGTDDGMENEAVLYAGLNFQDTYSRWGDYSSMAVDPNDDCTFWYTTEYSTQTNVFGVYNFFWGTVIGSFHFTNCTANP